MASGLYLEAVRRFVGAGASLDIVSNSTSIYVALISNDYTFNNTSADTAAILTNRIDKVGGDASFTADTLLSPTVTTSGNIVAVDGASGLVITSISSSQTLGGLLIYYRAANDADSIPICFISIAAQQTNGATINVNWDTGTNKIFSINAASV